MKTLNLLFLLFCVAPSFAQTTLTVDNSPNSGAMYQSVQAAIDASSVGDTIYVHPSPTSYGNITVTKTLHFRGPGHAPQYSNGMNAEIGNITLNALIGAPGITISGLTFSNLSVTGTQNYNDLQISNCRIGKVTGGNGAGQCNNWVVVGSVMVASNFDNFSKFNSNGWMIANNYVYQPATGNSWNLFRNFNATDVIRNNIIVTNQVSPLAKIFENCTNLSVENSLFLFTNTATGVSLSGNGITFNNCLSYSYPGLTLADLPGSNNFDNTEPEFVNMGGSPTFSSSKDFNLADGSPGENGGTDGEDIGIYGGSFPFNKYGYPPNMPYPVFMEITNPVIGVGGTLNVVFEAVGN